MIPTTELLAYISRAEVELMLAHRATKGEEDNARQLVWLQARELHRLRQVLAGGTMPSNQAWLAACRDLIKRRQSTAIENLARRLPSLLPAGTYPSPPHGAISNPHLQQYLNIREHDLMIRALTPSGSQPAGPSGVTSAPWQQSQQLHLVQAHFANTVPIWSARPDIWKKAAISFKATGGPEIAAAFDRAAHELAIDASLGTFGPVPEHPLDSLTAAYRIAIGL